MSKLNLKTRESKASKGSDSKSDSSKLSGSDKPKSKDELGKDWSSSSSSGRKPGSKFAGGKSENQITAMDKQQKAADSLYEFNKFAASGNTAKTASVGDKNQRLSDSGPRRFSDHRQPLGPDDEGNIVKIIVFIVVVIAIGLGIIYFIQNVLINTDQLDNDNANSTTSSVPAVTTLPGLEIGNITLADTQADGTAANSKYTNEELSVGSDQNDNEDAQVDVMTYQSYDSFTRVTWELKNVNAGFPGTTIMLDDSDNSIIIVQFNNVTNERDSLKEPIVPTVGNLDLIELAETADALEFTLNAIEEVEYYAGVNVEGNTLTLDIKTQTQLEQPAFTSTVSTTTSQTSSAESTASISTSKSSETSSSTTTSSSSTSTVSGDNKLTNTKSRGAQEIVNNTSNLSVRMTNYTYQDFGPYMDFNWEFEGSGIDSVPNVQADIIQDGGVFFIEVFIDNLEIDAFQTYGVTVEDFDNINTQYANLKEVEFKGRTGDRSRYLMRLSGLDDYQLTATEVSDEGRRRVKVRVYD